MAVVVPRAGLLAESTGLAAGVLPAQPVVAVARAGLREDSGRWAWAPQTSAPPRPARGLSGVAASGRRAGQPAWPLDPHGLRVTQGEGHGDPGEGQAWPPRREGYWAQAKEGHWAPTEARRGGPGGGVAQPGHQGERAKGQLPQGLAAPCARSPPAPRLSNPLQRGLGAEGPRRGARALLGSPRPGPTAAWPRACSYLRLCWWPPLCTWRGGGADLTPALPDPCAQVSAQPAHPRPSAPAYGLRGLTSPRAVGTIPAPAAGDARALSHSQARPRPSA